MTIINRELHQRLSNLQACAEHAPEGTYERAKLAAQVIEDCAEAIFDIVKAAGFKLNGTDRFSDVEALLYGVLADSNPDEYSLITGEGFGAAMDGPAKGSVIANTISDRDCLRVLGVLI